MRTVSLACCGVMLVNWQNRSMNSVAGTSPLEYSEAVHRLAVLIPPGAVLSYGDVAELLGSGGARQVGKAMVLAPSGTPWWRILRSNGTINDSLLQSAQQHWLNEGLSVPGRRISMKNFRWQPDELAWEKIDSLRTALGNPKMSEIDDQL